MPMAECCSILKRFDLETAVERVYGNLRMQQSTSLELSNVLEEWLVFLPREVTSQLELALRQAIPFMPPDFTPEVLAVVNEKVPPLTHIDVICVCLHFAMESHNYRRAAALIFTVDRALYRLGRSKPLLEVVRDLCRVSPSTAIAPQVTLRQARVLKDEGDLNGALRVIHVIISREDGWQYKDERQYLDTKAACLHVQGQIYHNLELWHSAIPPLVEGFQIFCQVQDRKGIGSVLHVLSRCLCRLQQEQYDQFRMSHPDVFEEVDPCYEGYRQGKAAVNNVQHTDDSFFVVKHQLVADESLLMFTVQNPCVIHFNQHLKQILQEIRSSMSSYRSVNSLQNVESFVEFIRAVFLASLVLFRSHFQEDKQHADKLENLSLKMYTAMCCGDKERSQFSSTKQTTQSTSFTQTSESVGLMNEALALLGLPKFQWKPDGSDDQSSSETSLKSLPSDPESHNRAVLDNSSTEHQENDFPCNPGKTKPGPGNDIDSCLSSNPDFSDQSSEIRIDQRKDKRPNQSRAEDGTPKESNPGDGQNDQNNSCHDLIPEISNSRPLRAPDQINSGDLETEESIPFQVVNELKECDDLEPENASQNDSYEHPSSDVDFGSEQIGLTSCGDNDNQRKAAIDQDNKSASPLDTPGKQDSTKSVAWNEYSREMKNLNDLPESRDISCARFSKQTNPAVDVSSEPVKTYHVDSMSTSAQSRQGHQTVLTEYGARASTVPERSSRKDRRSRRSAPKQGQERYVGLAMSREELRAATWPALSTDAENSLEEHECTEQEEEDNLNALSISTNTTTSSNGSFKKFTKDMTSSGLEIVANVSTVPDLKNSNRSGENSSMYKLSPMIPPFSEEKSQTQTRHVCSSCSQSIAGCSTVDQNASTKSSSPQTPETSVSSLLPHSQQKAEDNQNHKSDSLLSSLFLNQEHENKEQRKQVISTWQPSQPQQVHRAVLLTFDVWTGLWRRQSTLIHMGDALPLANTSPTKTRDGDAPPQTNPRGAFRDAFIVSFLHQGEPLAKYVGKKYRTQRPPQEYMRDVTDQMVASYYVTLFNDALSSHQSEFLTIHFLPAFHLQVLNSEGEVCDWLNVEPYMDGRYDKITNNAGYVASDHPHLRTGTQVATAFSHFSYVCSQGRYMVVDLQGCVPDDNKGVIYLTDPVLHTTDRSSPFDRHERGMADFFQRVHTDCNDICRLLQLDQHRSFS